MLDPMAKTLRERAAATGRDPKPLLGMREIFSEALASSPVFIDQVTETFQSFYEVGARTTLLKNIA